MALALLGAQILACVLAHLHLAPIDAAWERDPERLRGVLHSHPADVWAARQVFALVWSATLPLAFAATLLAASAMDRFRAEGAVRAFAQLVTMAGLLTCVAGVFLAILAVLEILSP